MTQRAKPAYCIAIYDNKEKIALDGSSRIGGESKVLAEASDLKSGVVGEVEEKL